MIELYTVQLARWRLAQSKNIVVVDTTVKSAPKSGYGFLAPSWDIVMGVKSGEITEEEYTNTYIRMLDYSVVANADKWRELLALPRFAFACFCSSGKFCHRHLLASYFQSYAKEQGVELRLMGELTMGPGERQNHARGRINEVNSPKQPDNIFSSIVQTMLTTARRNRSGSIPEGVSRGQYLSDYCTVGFTAPRQSGKTRWALEELVDNPEAIAIVREPLSAAFNQHYDRTVRDRVYTEEELQEAIDQMRKPYGRDELRERFDRVYVDDATLVFTKVRRSAFYAFLGQRQLDLDVVLIN